VKGAQVQEMITFVGTPTTEKGVIHGVGKGVLMTTGGREGGEPEMATYTGEGNRKNGLFRKYKMAWLCLLQKSLWWQTLISQ
jgi:hypothetical protein